MRMTRNCGKYRLGPIDMPGWNGTAMVARHGRRIGHRAGLLAATSLLALALGAAPAAAQDQAAPIALPQMDVNATPDATSGYAAQRTSSATKTDTPLRDIPQSVTVVTQQAIRDLSMQNLGDVLRYVPGAG